MKLFICFVALGAIVVTVQAGGWVAEKNYQPLGHLWYTGTAYDCSTAHNQCYWTNLATAQRQCAAWSSCKFLYQSELHWPAREGRPVYWARTAGGKTAEWGAVLWKQGSCGRPRGWCTHSGSTYKLSDCDRDGVPDHTCRDTRGNLGVIQSAANCKGSWPNGKCSDSCSRPRGWCSHSGSTYRLSDCDGDGVRDHTCSDTRGQLGVIQSAANCQDSWPNGKCAGWVAEKNYQPLGLLWYTGRLYGCSTVHRQCYWTNLATAQGNCAAWSSCKFLYQSEAHWPASRGRPVYWARTAGETRHELGAVLWKQGEK